MSTMDRVEFLHKNQQLLIDLYDYKHDLTPMVKNLVPVNDANENQIIDVIASGSGTNTALPPSVDTPLTSNVVIEQAENDHAEPTILEGEIKNLVASIENGNHELKHIRRGIGSILTSIYHILDLLRDKL